ncbi:hypothetical protein T492DRAFT_848180 [Pavlovales sp. CCMP2436]|nr:hypothetical protein T492DRAFT_848180 [Pavlovales sp. CCMP2436]
MFELKPKLEEKENTIKELFTEQSIFNFHRATQVEDEASELRAARGDLFVRALETCATSSARSLVRPFMWTNSSAPLELLALCEAGKSAAISRRSAASRTKQEERLAEHKKRKKPLLKNALSRALSRELSCSAGCTRLGDGRVVARAVSPLRAVRAEKQKEAAKLAELESKFVLCETVYACGIAPCEIAKATRCPTCRTIAESSRACGKGPGRGQPLLQQRPRLSNAARLEVQNYMPWRTNVYSTYDSVDRSGSQEAIDS